MFSVCPQGWQVSVLQWFQPCLDNNFDPDFGQCRKQETLAHEIHSSLIDSFMFYCPHYSTPGQIGGHFGNNNWTSYMTDDLAGEPQWVGVEAGNGIGPRLCWAEGVTDRARRNPLTTPVYGPSLNTDEKPACQSAYLPCSRFVLPRLRSPHKWKIYIASVASNFFLHPLGSDTRTSAHTPVTRLKFRCLKGKEKKG